MKFGDINISRKNRNVCGGVMYRISEDLKWKRWTSGGQVDEPGWEENKSWCQCGCASKYSQAISSLGVYFSSLGKILVGLAKQKKTRQKIPWPYPACGYVLLDLSSIVNDLK